MKLRLARIAHARSGDKADRADIGLFAWDAAGYAVLKREVTAERVAAHFAPWLADGAVERYPLPNILAIKFVLQRRAARRRRPQPAQRQPRARRIAARCCAWRSTRDLGSDA